MQNIKNLKARISEFLFNTILEDLEAAIGQRKVLSESKMEKKSDGIILYMEKPKDYTKNFLETINWNLNGHIILQARGKE